MLSLNRSGFLRCDEKPGLLVSQRWRMPLAPAGVRCAARGGGELNGRGIAVDNTVKELRGEAEPVLEPKSAGGVVEDAHGEDGDVEEQFIMPWTVSVASGYSLLRNPQHNKGLAFNEKERDAHYLRGLLPPACVTQELQEKKIMHNLRQYQVPLQRYVSMMDLQERNEKLFYKLLIDHVEELLPIVYTPTVGEACQKYGSIFGHPQGLYISLNERGKILEVLRNWPERNIQVIVVTDGERILGLGDLGCQGMGIPVGKLALYTALGGLRPSACLPVTIDVGTNNEQLLKDEFYIGLRRRRATGQEYAELMHEFMTAVKQRYGEKVLIQFEDFANHNAFELLAKYRKTHLVFNDDIQGTASVVLAGLFAALNIVGGTLAEHSFLFLGAGEAGTGIAELIAREMSKQTKAPLEETRKKIWMVDSKGLIVSSRKESLQHFKKPWAHDHEPVGNLLDAVKAIKPTVLIGSSGVGRTFTKEVVEAMATFNEKPIILALSNPTTQSECSAEEAYTWSKVNLVILVATCPISAMIRDFSWGSIFCLKTGLPHSQGRAIFASGSPFDPVEYDEKIFVPGQANNAYIFPGFGLGLVISGATRVHDDMLLAASEALAQQVTQENLDKGLIYPPFSNIRKISAHIAANVAAKAYELGLASRLPCPKDLVKYAESCMYNPVYRSYR
ncbi:NADP-dependent malic enzyme isoform X1 [Musa acuminata AAA Group]|uniref:NADP-dependent malic enzyme isoform X1 n=1 Tax=Musa acuminata AAA Group TaxID=214697 RepID=UPI0031DB4EF5